MATTYNAGIVTAYGAAVRGSYTGTYEEYCTEQAHIGTNAQTAEAAAQRAEQAASSVTDVIAPAFSTSTAYTSGDYVLYGGKLYQFTADHAAGAWTGTDAEETSIAEKLGDGSGDGLTDGIKSALLQIARKVAYIDENGQTYYDALYDALYAVTAIRLNTNFISLQAIGATSQLTATTTPEGGRVTWSSSNDSVATVSDSGLVTSVAYGSATITATAGSVSAKNR